LPAQSKKWGWTEMDLGHNVEPSKARMRRVCSRPLRLDFKDHQMMKNNLARPFSPNPKKDRLQSQPPIIC
jgi:hypothetical protein